MAGEDGVRLSLAGAQDKIAVYKKVMIFSCRYTPLSAKGWQ